MTDEHEALEACVGALQFILAFYEPGQTYLDTEAWKSACAGGVEAYKRGVTRAMGHSPNGQDPQGLGAKPEWPGLANGEMRPPLSMTQRNLTNMERALKFDAALQSLCKPGPATLWLEGVEVLAMRVPRRSAAPAGLSRDASQAKPAAAIARGAQ